MAIEIHNEWTDLKEGTRSLWANTGITNYTLAHLELAKKRSKFRRRAVIIGINKYKLGEDASLSGCVNDGRDFGNTLLVCGFPPSNIRYLFDERATKTNIIKQLNWLTDDAEPGDVLVVYWSGHGTQKRDITGNEIDKLTEMVIPHDFDWYNEETHFTDDDFYNYLTTKVPKGTRTEAIIDTCYSGTGTRSLMRRQEGDMTARWLAPPLELIQIGITRPPTYEKRDYFAFSNVGQKSKGSVGLQNNTTWSACQDYQVAWELNINDAVRGAFTYNFCEIMRKREGNITRETFYSLLRNKMYQDGYEQIPDMETGSEEALRQYAFRRNFEDDETEIAENQG